MTHKQLRILLASTYAKEGYMTLKPVFRRCIDLVCIKDDSFRDIFYCQIVNTSKRVKAFKNVSSKLDGTCRLYNYINGELVMTEEWSNVVYDS